MSTKQTEALKLALEALEYYADMTEEPSTASGAALIVREALAEQPAQGCDYCNHPQYAGTKCKNCGREQSAQQEPKIGCVNHDCDKCKARQQQEHVSLMTVLHLKDRTEIGYGPASAGYDLPTGEYKLYTSPPASKQWVGLTSEERDAILNREFKQWWSRHDVVCRAIEAKLREKNA